VQGVRLHDLRHSFASFAIADGASLFLVGKLLGHASARTAERYAHLSGDPLQDAAAAIGKKLMPTEEPEPGEGEEKDKHTGEVVQLRPGA
jgi:integrase